MKELDITDKVDANYFDLIDADCTAKYRVGELVALSHRAFDEAIEGIEDDLTNEWLIVKSFGDCQIITEHLGKTQTFVWGVVYRVIPAKTTSLRDDEFFTVEVDEDQIEKTI